MAFFYTLDLEAVVKINHSLEPLVVKSLGAPVVDSDTTVARVYINCFTGLSYSGGTHTMNSFVDGMRDLYVQK